ncbi:MAG: ferredoxin [Pirellulaceae bacterium]|nr:MAG: ferredoxin [Pirellulaceae bacterium]
MPIIKFVKENKEVEVPVGTNLRKAAIRAGINLNCGLNGFGASINKYLNCKGHGMCGTCRVLITKGMENTNPMTKREWYQFKQPFHIPPDPIPCLAFIGHEDTMRLACMVRVNGDIEVESCPPVNLFGENFFS